MSPGIPYIERYWARSLAARQGKVIAENTVDKILLNGLQLRLRKQVRITLEQFEPWILPINGGSLDPALVARFNAEIDGNSRHDLHWDFSAQSVPFGSQRILYLTDTADQGAFTCVLGFHHCLKWLAELRPDVDPGGWSVLEALPASRNTSSCCPADGM